MTGTQKASREQYPIFPGVLGRCPTVQLLHANIKETWIGASPQARVVPIKKLGIKC